MNTWDDLLSVAISGTARRAPDKVAWRADLGVQVDSLSGEVAGQLLDAAALATVARRAGITTVPVRPAVDDVAPADARPVVPESLTSVMMGSPEHIRYILGRAAELDLRLPARYLPWLFGIASSLDRAVVQTLAGSRGEWLAAHNPEWARLYPVEVTFDTGDDRPWREGIPTERLGWLGQLRRRDIEASQPYVAAALAARGEPAPIKQAVIQLLKELPHPADDELLEACLDARTGEVRRATQDALAERPASAYGARMLARFHAWIHVKHRPLSIEMELPATPSAADIRDGLNLPFSARQPERRLVDLMRCIPLREWEVWGTPSELLSAGAPESSRASLRAGWASRAVVEGNEYWAGELLRAGVGHPELGTTPLLRLVSDQVRDEISRALLTPFLEGALTPFITDWFRSVPFPLPDDVLAQFIAGFPAAMARPRSDHVLLVMDRIGAEQPGDCSTELGAIAPQLSGRGALRLEQAFIRHTTRAQIEQTLVDVLQRARPDESPHQQNPPTPPEETP